VTGALIFVLSATDLIFVELGNFGMTPFWAIFGVTLLQSKLGLAARGATAQGFRLLGALGAAFVLTTILSPGGTRETSLALSLAYVSFGFWLLSATHHVGGSEIKKALKGVVLAYLLSSILAYLLILTGQAEGPLAMVGKSSFDINSQTYRIQALSSEPSYAAIVIACCSLGMLRLRAAGALFTRNELAIWGGGCLLLIVCFESILGYILALVVLTTVLNQKVLMVLIAVAAVVAGTMNTIQGDHRIFNILEGMLSGDMDYWMELDGSSFMRFGPLSFFVDNASLKDYTFWFGHGAASSTAFFGDAFGGLAGKDVDTIQAGLIPAFLYDYGLFAAGFLIAFAYLCCQGSYKRQALLLFAATAFNANFNTQLFWFVLAVMALSSTMIWKNAEVQIEP